MILDLLMLMLLFKIFKVFLNPLTMPAIRPFLLNQNLRNLFFKGSDRRFSMESHFVVSYHPLSKPENTVFLYLKIETKFFFCHLKTTSLRVYMDKIFLKLKLFDTDSCVLHHSGMQSVTKVISG